MAASQAQALCGGAPLHSGKLKHIETGEVYWQKERQPENKRGQAHHKRNPKLQKAALAPLLAVEDGKNICGGKKSAGTAIAGAKRQRNQIRAIILFAGALLTGCMVLIPGENAWYGLHSFFMGMFGTWAILWPILLIYIAVMTAMENRWAVCAPNHFVHHHYHFGLFCQLHIF